MTLLLLHLVVKWQVFTINIHNKYNLPRPHPHNPPTIKPLINGYLAPKPSKSRRYRCQTMKHLAYGQLFSSEIYRGPPYVPLRNYSPIRYLHQYETSNQ